MKTILALLLISSPVIAMEQPKQVKPNQPAKITGIVVTPRAAVDAICFTAIVPNPFGVYGTVAKIGVALAIAEMARRDNQ
jgi:hypothetical protein